MEIVPRLSAWYEMKVFRRKPYLKAESYVKMKGVEFVDLPSTRVKGFEAVYHTFLCLLNLIFHRVDCVNVHNIGPGLFTPFLRLLGYPVVLTYHSSNYEHSKWGAISRAILRLGEYVSLRFSSAIIFVSPFQRMKYKQWVLDKSVALPNGISAHNGGENNTDFLKRIGVRPGSYILSVGRLTPEKGFETIVEAVQTMPEVEHLVVAGDSDHDASARERLASLDASGKVVLPGFTTGDDLTQLYSNARMFVLSSYSEGFPLVLLEAMSYSLPIVASDIPACHIIPLADDAYAEAGNPDSFRRAILKVLSTGEQRREYDLREFDWDGIARRTSSLYRDVMGME